MIAVMYSDGGIYDSCKEELISLFGKISKESEPYDFDKFTKYYEKEMGSGILKKFIIFDNEVGKDELSEIKLKTTEIEKKFSKDDKRQINLDPGYINASKLVLATCKNYSHRIYIGKGIFAEVTLHFHHGAFQSWPWTFPDYNTQGYIQAFNVIRETYLKQLKQ